MKTTLFKSRTILALLLLFFGCGKIPSTEELDKDISYATKEIEATAAESRKYSGGLIKVLVDVRKEILENTKAILEQKRTGIRRFIPVNYTVDGENYSVPENKQELLNKIESDLQDLDKKITDTQNEIAKFSGGLIKVMLLAQLATTQNTKAFLEQKLILLKYDIPLYTVMPSLEAGKDEPEFKPTPGKDIDKF